MIKTHELIAAMRTVFIITVIAIGAHIGGVTTTPDTVVKRVPKFSWFMFSDSWALDEDQTIIDA